MHQAWINIALAFLEGFALIISPCILPILPIILSGSLTGNKARPFGIIIGFIITFTLVTLFSKVLINLLHINPNILQNISYAILFLLGVMMVSSYLTDNFNLFTQRLTRVGNSLGEVNNPESGFSNGILFGGLVGIIWTPCAGPILAAVIVQVVIQQTTWLSILTVLAFAIGAGLPMLLIALLGRRLLERFSFIRNNTVVLRKILGIIIILSVIILFFTAGTFSFSKPSESSNNLSNTSSAQLSLINGLDSNYKAPDIAGIDAWINSQPLLLSDLKGKVVLLDFWTYSCINCIRTLPHLIDWYGKYRDKGFVIIGIHSPEFQFEHDLSNVKNAVAKFGILYPVALDNNFVTWRNYNNQYWPAHYLINKQGEVVYTHFGEGEYDVTENNIRYLLGLPATVIQPLETESFSRMQTPETYLGYARMQNFGSPETIRYNKSNIYSYPTILPQDSWALKGDWSIFIDKIVALEAGASLKLHFNAAKVYAVMGAPVTSVPVKLLFNDKMVMEQKGNDVTNSEVVVSTNRLYSLLEFQNATDGVLELIATQAGLEIYTFTFGA